MIAEADAAKRQQAAQQEAFAPGQPGGRPGNPVQTGAGSRRAEQAQPPGNMPGGQMKIPRELEIPANEPTAPVGSMPM
jgi:hypothetical protein